MSQYVNVTHQCRNSEVPRMHFLSQPVHLSTSVDENDSLSNGQGFVKITQCVQLPLLKDREKQLSALPKKFFSSATRWCCFQTKVKIMFPESDRLKCTDKQNAYQTLSTAGSLGSVDTHGDHHKTAFHLQ